MSGSDAGSDEEGQNDRNAAIGFGIGCFVVISFVIGLILYFKGGHGFGEAMASVGERCGDNAFRRMLQASFGSKSDEDEKSTWENVLYYAKIIGIILLIIAAVLIIVYLISQSGGDVGALFT